MGARQHFDVMVIGAGVFGAWTAHFLQRSGAQVLLVDAFGPGNSRSSSGGESRVIRRGYGADEIYTRLAQHSMWLWRSFFEQRGLEHFKQSGVLWLAREGDMYSTRMLSVLAATGVRFEKLERADLERRYPQIGFGPITWGIIEIDSGVLLARYAVQAVVADAVKCGVSYLTDSINSPTGAFTTLTTRTGRRFSADSFIFACGPWLPNLFPDLLRNLIHITRQEVFFFGVPPGDDRFSFQKMPVLIDFEELVYCIPDLEGRGFKFAIDAHGPTFDPDSGDRVVASAGVKAVRQKLARLIPALGKAPILETRVCQYENTSSGDFLIDRHPDFPNVWLVGGGSGHGFKHGPAVGEYVASLIKGNAEVEPRFTLATKIAVHQRKVF